MTEFNSNTCNLEFVERHFDALRIYWNADKVCGSNGVSVGLYNVVNFSAGCFYICS